MAAARSLLKSYIRDVYDTFSDMNEDDDDDVSVCAIEHIIYMLKLAQKLKILEIEKHMAECCEIELGLSESCKNTIGQIASNLLILIKMEISDLFISLWT